MSDEIDPEIAALLGDIQNYTPKSSAASKADSKQSQIAAPSFESLFGDMSVSGEMETKGAFDLDLSKKKFDLVTKTEEDKPNTFFNEPDYYQVAMSGEGEISQRFHDLLKKFLNPKDPKDKGMYRQQVITAYWNLASRIIPRVVSAKPVLPKQLMIRFGIALPTMLTPEQRDMFNRVIYQKTGTEMVFYMDEWLRNIAMGNISPSSTDEVRTSQGDERSRLNNLLQRAVGKRDTAEALLKAKADERKVIEGVLSEKLLEIKEHSTLPGFIHVPAPYSEGQKKTIQEAGELLRKLLASDRELVSSIDTYEDASKDVQTLREKVQALGDDVKADLQALSGEFDTARQMLKMCVGRQGNHFPLITREYLHLNLREMGTRENVINALAWLESIDTEVYCRPYKSQLNRIEPFVILLPCYGDIGVCWEPFDKYNRQTSRSRLAVPMYPKNLRVAIATAAADMRWQAAKEKASYYWMEEGLTGHYYQWFQRQKLKGDVKEFFIQDYITWITKESDGIQKLDKDVRGIFWRMIPFQQHIKDKLRDRSVVYQDLYQRDVNRSLSDGY